MTCCPNLTFYRSFAYDQSLNMHGHFSEFYITDRASIRDIIFLGGSEKTKEACVVGGLLMDDTEFFTPLWAGLVGGSIFQFNSGCLDERLVPYLVTVFMEWQINLLKKISHFRHPCTMHVSLINRQFFSLFIFKDTKNREEGKSACQIMFPCEKRSYM